MPPKTPQDLPSNLSGPGRDVMSWWGKLHILDFTNLVISTINNTCPGRIYHGFQIWVFWKSTWPQTPSEPIFHGSEPPLFCVKSCDIVKKTVQNLHKCVHKTAQCVHMKTRHVKTHHFSRFMDHSRIFMPIKWSKIDENVVYKPGTKRVFVCKMCVLSKTMISQDLPLNGVKKHVFFCVFLFFKKMQKKTMMKSQYT